jgi:zinc protease
VTLLLEISRDTPLCWGSVTFQGGSACDPAGLEGLAHHAFELARRGAGSHTRAAIDDTLDALGAALFVGTGWDSVTFSIQCLSRNLETVWSVLSDVVASPAMADVEHEQLMRETRRDLDELRDDDGLLASRFFARSVRPGYAYARTSIGTAGSLDAIDLAAARAEMSATATRGGAIFGFAGDLGEEQGRDLSAELTRRLRPGPARPQPDLSVPEAVPGRHLVLVDKPDRAQSQILIGHIGPRWGSDDALALLPVETAFGGMFTSRLTQTIRVEHGWSYGADCQLSRAKAPYWFRLSMAPAAEVTADALGCALEMYGALCTDGISEEELAFAKDYLIGNMPFARATARQRLRRALQNTIYELGEDFDAKLADRLRRVTLPTTRRAIDANLSASDLCVVVVCTADRLRAELEALGWDSVTVEDYESY